MRKLIMMILVSAVALVNTVCFAENPTISISATLEAVGITNPVQLQLQGEIAVCLAEKEGVKTLCILERQNDSWCVIINNSSALIQDMDWPELWLENDHGVSWTYTLSDYETLSYHSKRNGDGSWGKVDQTYSYSGHGGQIYSWNTSWDDAHGGEVIHTSSIPNEDDNVISVGDTAQYFPAFWLGDYINLADFDLTRFPVLISPQYGSIFISNRFFQDAAAALMPDCIYVQGLVKEGDLHFLVQKPDGTKAYVICDYASQHQVNLIESAALPADTYLGVDNFPDCLWINQCCIALHLLSDRRTLGIEYVYSDSANGTDGGFLFFRDRLVWSDAEDEIILYGDHPWNDPAHIDWNTIPRNLDEAASRMDSSKYAMVINSKPSDRLNLREQADKSSLSVGKYYTGTPVTIISSNRNWALVGLGNAQSTRQGYMMVRYLILGKADRALRLDTSAMPDLYPRSDLLLVYEESQKGKSNPYYGNNMKIIGVIGDEWYHVWFPDTGEYGFVLQSDLWEGNG